MKIGSPFHLYMMEAEGMLDTRESRIQAAIKDFKDLHRRGYDINSSTIQDQVLNKHNLEDITQREASRIANSL